MSAQMNGDGTEGSQSVVRTGLGVIAIAVILDVFFVLVFASSGRSQHGEVSSIEGTFATAWPFLLALLLSWVLSFAWRRPFAMLRSGLPIWLGTVALGMLFRVWFTTGGAPLPFVLVATGTLGVSLIGWRAIAALIKVLRSRRKQA
ncbi:DUF3054 domain-containing protein [Leucobacter sp. UT-8R-CII-1-4]|uniref:DUF3054 domain-containing protein n=1 Tax=Leucobacter sp. UT-8R-CII-1-4 TaxID=3040075 RepID=UPI0024A85B4C|nr:DUF3054 domain-containing protein [Leucobacter sp. UT-8R-CII-1-4]MDI6024420.1 DUF3054 domain-containing protein [Leucobacter sp. UT-8R-CII-1-4]